MAEPFPRRNSKIIISLILGWLSFAISLFPIEYTVGTGKTSLNLGLFIPLLISMAWGWKYGLITAIPGLGTMYGIFVWQFAGWGALIGTISHTVWIAIHGYFESKNKLRGERTLFRYYVELGTRAVFVIIYFLVFPWAVAHNPPPWGIIPPWQPIIMTEANTQFMIAIMFKQSMEGLITLTLVDVLLNTYRVRKLMGLSFEKKEVYTTSSIALYSFLGIVIVSIDILIEILFGSTETYLEELLFNQDRTENRYRILIIITMAIAGVIHSNYMKTNRLLQSKLRLSQKRDAIGTLVGGVAHDFNNILSPIQGHAELIDLILSSSDDINREEIQEQIQTIKESSDRAKKLIKKLLSYSQPFEADYHPIDMTKPVIEVVELLKSTIPKSISMEIDIPEHEIIITADSDQIYLIVLNLMTNAYQAIGEVNQGKIHLRLNTIMLDYEHKSLPQGEYAHLNIQDTGCGIHNSIMDKIFDPYFSTKDLESNSAGSGTGLGLSTVKGILDELGGYLEVSSIVDVGTMFSLFFPITQRGDEDQKEDQIDPNVIKGSTEKILVVDDELPIINYLGKMLTRLNYSPVVFSSSKDALHWVKSGNKPDLLLTDLSMPEMNGIELSKELLQLLPGLPIILCTGRSTVHSYEKSIALGIKKYLLKPVSTEEITSTIHALLHPKTSD
ncbi:MAG: response regulator [Candidatus Heimdallarchaeota archaeon]|nr:response regulator [Candidatus Heimdallarchaeota archaeon]